MFPLRDPREDKNIF